MNKRRSLGMWVPFSADQFADAKITASEIADLSKSLEAQSMASTKRLEIKAAARNAELTIYGEIGEFGITALAILDALKELRRAKAIDVHLNTPGGSVSDAIAIYNNLVQHPARITMHIDGLAASGGSLVAMAGDKILMAENAFLMVHDPVGMAMGPADTMRKMAEILDKAAGLFVETYAARTGASPDDIRAMMTAETWFTAAEALEAGFIDEIMPVKSRVEALASDLLALYENTPDALQPHDATWIEDAKQRLRLRGRQHKT